MEIAITVAMTPQRLIGYNNRIPWHQPADLQRFKKLTMGHPIVMGRKTFESLPGFLPGRQHIVLTRDKHYDRRGCFIATSWEQVADATRDSTTVFVIGGAEVYRYALPIAKRMYMTIVQVRLAGDVYFPAWQRSDWQEMTREFRAKDEHNKFDMEFVQYRRVPQ